MDTVATVVRRWQKRRAPVCTARTNATNMKPVERICDYFGKLEVDCLYQDHIEDFRNMLLDLGVSKLTAARHLIVLRAALNGKAAEGIEFARLIAELRRGPNMVQCWTREEAQLILKACSFGSNAAKDQIDYFIRLLFATGCRRGEALAVSSSDIDFKRNRIHIHRSLALDGSIQDGTKWGGERLVPITEVFSDRLSKYIATIEHPKGWLFTQLNQRSVGRQFNRVRDLAGVKPLKMHCTRHTAISLALADGMSLRKASEIFGVSQQILERHYAHFVEEKVPMGWASL